MAESIAIGGHVRPDGDCIGSTMGLCQYIRENYEGKSVDVYLEPIPDKFKFIEAAEDIRHEAESGKIYDLFISLDCAEKHRLGFSEPLFDAARHTLCVDHHVSNISFADENRIEPDASSTSELVYGMLDKGKISRKTAEALYLGIAHDTGVFRYSCTSPATMRVAAELMEKGIDASGLIRDTYYEKTYAQNQVLGYALLNSRLLLNGRCIAACIRGPQMEAYGAVRADLDGIVSQMRDTTGVEASVFMDEIAPDTYKVSLRSDACVDVSEIAQMFGGGGHRRAAGATMEGDPDAIIARLAEEIGKQLERQV